MSNWILRTHFDSLTELIRHIGDSNSAVRATAELDGLRISGDESMAMAKEVLLEPQSEEDVSAATLAAFELQATDLSPTVLSHLNEESVDLCNGVRRGLRLCNVRSVVRDLFGMYNDAGPLAKIAILDVLSFHRLKHPTETHQLMTVEDPDFRCLLLECLGRLGNANLVETFASDTDPAIRKAFWKAMARSGHPDLANKCRHRCIHEDPCHDAIRFLGVIGVNEDAQLLRRLYSNESAKVPAVEAMGKNGATEFVPDLLAALKRKTTADAAAIALERISGRSVPRSDPPPPPDHLTEDELDFWFHPGDPIPDAADQWWKQNHYYFEPGKRYQAGVCVSDDPLGPHFDQLPDEIRADVYLRERALNPKTTPDWELETWPRYQRNPAWASKP